MQKGTALMLNAGFNTINLTDNLKEIDCQNIKMPRMNLDVCLDKNGCISSQLFVLENDNKITRCC